VTFNKIEIRAATERYDVHARQLAREISHLPIQTLPSLAAISQPALSIRTAQLYLLTGNLSTSQLDQLNC
jgi:phosphoribosylformylglycinamidine synthase subunit PurSL